jgi:hypothetical protein
VELSDYRLRRVSSRILEAFPGDETNWTELFLVLLG